MKIKIKSTGEIKEVLYDEERNLFYYKEGNDTIYYLSGYEVISQDWEQRRFELVKAAMQGTISLIENGSFSSKNLSAKIIELADAVLQEYRKGGKE